MVADTCWRADTRGSGSSAEVSVSSLTNGTHSSLNTEMEEDELAYSVEQNVQCNAYMHFNGYACGKVTDDGLVSPYILKKRGRIFKRVFFVFSLLRIFEHHPSQESTIN